MLFVDGHLLPEDAVHISALDRGFTLGDSVFDTVRVHRGRPFRLAAHLERLRRSARTIGMEIPQTDTELAAALSATLAAEHSASHQADADLSEAVVRITVSRGIACVRGLLPITEAPTLVIQASPFAAPAVDKYVDGSRAIVSRIRRNETSPTAIIKSGNYLEGVLARMEARRNGTDDALFLNTAGHLACATAANLFWVKDGTLSTPAVTCGVLAGIVRDLIIEAALDKDIPAQAVADPLAALLNGDEAFLTNVVIGVLPLTYVNEQAIGAGRPGPLTGQMMQVYRQALDEECG